MLKKFDPAILYVYLALIIVAGGGVRMPIPR